MLKYFSYFDLSKKLKITLHVGDGSGVTARMSALDKVAERLVDITVADAWKMSELNGADLDSRMNVIVSKQYKLKVGCHTKVSGENTFINYNIKFDTFFFFQQ